MNWSRFLDLVSGFDAVSPGKHVLRNQRIIVTVLLQYVLCQESWTKMFSFCGYKVNNCSFRMKKYYPAYSKDSNASKDGDISVRKPIFYTN